MSLPGKPRCAHDAEHICHTCQGKAAKRLWRQVVKRQKRREERVWKRDQGL